MVGDLHSKSCRLTALSGTRYLVLDTNNSSILIFNKSRMDLICSNGIILIGALAHIYTNGYVAFPAQVKVGAQTVRVRTGTPFFLALLFTN